ncbi:MAG: C4-type zinc ribbon domain-containing protein [Clostridia bacterium]
MEKILKYQEVDRKYIQLENSLRTCEEAKKMLSYKEERKKISDELLTNNQLAENYFSKIESVKTKYSEALKELEEMHTADMENMSEKELDFYIKKLEKSGAMVGELERECDKIARDLKQIEYTSKVDMDNLKKCSMLYQKYQELFNAKKEQMQVEAKQIFDERNLLEKELDPKILDMYKKVRENKKNPVFVELDQGNSCKGCGMQVTTETLDKFNIGEQLVQCPNCGRILYKKA